MSKKDYRQGMSDAMAAYEAFGEKQEAAIQHVGAEIEKTAGKVDKLGGKIGEIADYITDKEKAALYKLNTPVDIADLEDAEKRILLAVLYQLSADEDEVTEEQQNYVRAVQQYLKIYNPQTEIDLSAVENIEDISAQKAVLQSALEFFRLGTHPEELTEEQEEFLDYFQVNRKTHREINGFIDAIVDVVGVKGLSEKYGFVAEQPRSEFAKYQDNGRIPEKVADICIAQYQKSNKIPLLVQSFSNGQKFLETKDYLIFFVKNHFSHCSDNDDVDDDCAVGFFRIDKKTGKTVRINVDHALFNSSFCVVKNTIYGIIFDTTDQYPRTKVSAQIVALNLDEQTSKTLPFEYSDYIGYNDSNVHFHISGDDSSLVLCVLTKSTDDDSEEVSMKTKTYAVDLAQDNRTFLLKSGLDFVYDAFLWNGKFLFWGKKGNIESIFQYDPRNKHLEDLFEDVRSYKGFSDNFTRVLNRGLWPDETLTVIEQMQCVDEKYFFLTSHEEDDERLYEYTGMNLQNPQKCKFWFSIFSKGSIILLDDCALHFEADLGDEEFGMERFDYSTADTTGQSEDDEVADTYILLGDYLYRYYPGEGWQKTNISSGWDNLQWEIFQMPD
jgi:hypothetical protein